MLFKLRNHAPLAVASVALFFAIGGPSFAADAVDSAARLLTGKNVKNSSLTGIDIKNSSLTTSDVKNRSLLAADFKSGQLPAGPRGAKGDTGAQGPKGDAGTFDPTTTTITVQRQDVSLPAGPSAGNPGAEVDGFVGCLAGQTMIGGSVNTSSPSGATTLISRPATDNVGNGGIPDDGEGFSFWKGTARTETNAAATMRVFAICASKPAAP